MSKQGAIEVALTKENFLEVFRSALNSTRWFENKRISADIFADVVYASIVEEEPPQIIKNSANLIDVECSIELYQTPATGEGMFRVPERNVVLVKLDTTEESIDITLEAIGPETKKIVVSYFSEDIGRLKKFATFATIHGGEIETTLWPESEYAKNAKRLCAVLNQYTSELEELLTEEQPEQNQETTFAKIQVLTKRSRRVVGIISDISMNYTKDNTKPDPKQVLDFVGGFGISIFNEARGSYFEDIHEAYEEIYGVCSLELLRQQILEIEREQK